MGIFTGKDVWSGCHLLGPACLGQGHPILLGFGLGFCSIASVAGFTYSAVPPRPSPRPPSASALLPPSLSALSSSSSPCYPPAPTHLVDDGSWEREVTFDTISLPKGAKLPLLLHCSYLVKVRMTR